MATNAPAIILKNITKYYGGMRVLSGVDFKITPGEVTCILGDNGAGKSTLIKCLSGADQPDTGSIKVSGTEVSFKKTLDSRAAGIETVYQTLAVAPALDIASNLFLGREIRRSGVLGSVFRLLDFSRMKKEALVHITTLGIGTIQNIGQAVETLSGGQRQAVSVARAAAFGQKVVILDEPTAALGVRESGQVLKLIEGLRDKKIPVILISHNMPQVFEVADRIQVMRLGKRAAVVTPKTHDMTDVVGIMTGALTLDTKDQSLTPVK